MTIGEPRVGVKVRTMKYLHFGVGVRGEIDCLSYYSPCLIEFFWEEELFRVTSTPYATRGMIVTWEAGVFFHPRTPHYSIMKFYSLSFL